MVNLIMRLNKLLGAFGNLDKIADWIKTQNFDYVYYNYLHESKEWNTQYLPLHIKQKIEKKLSNYDNDKFHKEQLQGAINFMMNNHLDNEKMTELRKIKILGSDQFRNESFAKTFPELKELVCQS